jgi:RNA polymerase sigma factor (sigma-70 family)
MLTDLQLLSRYHLHGDATAFRDLVAAHAGMVFATAHRITGDQARAEDVAQETFFQLARQSQNITQSVAAWLHRVAWRRACNAVRDDATRRRIEEQAAIDAATTGSTEQEASWAELEVVVDEAIDELPDDLRTPLIMHFMQGRSQRDIAGQLGVSQSSISRLLEEGISTLRSQLKSRGVLCGAGLAALLTANTATAAPAALIVVLGKLSLSGIGMAAGASGGAASVSWLIQGVVVLTMILGAVVMVRDRLGQQVAQPQSLPVDISMPAGKVSVLPAVVPPAGLMKTSAKPGVADALPIEAAAKPMPVHELVHSFPKPPKMPSGHLVMDDAGWLWGTTNVGGRYGMGTVYRMKVDGSQWEVMVSFNGEEGEPKGAFPNEGLVRAPDGRLWGVSGGAGSPARIFCFDPQSGKLSQEIEFQRGEEPLGLPLIFPLGLLCYNTRNGTHLYDPSAGFRGVLNHRKLPLLGEMVADGRGWLWATSEKYQGHGAVCKLNHQTGELVEVLVFTGKSGAFIGSKPVCGLTLGADGFLWGCTRNGGARDEGTIFKIHPESGAFTSVSQLQRRDGMNPESMLVDDGRGYLWGTATYGSMGRGYGHGTIYKIEQRSGKLTVVVRFTGYDGAAPGGVPRAHLLRAGPDHMVGVTGFLGAAGSGVIYDVEISTRKYTVLKDLADLAATTEGVEPHGSLVESGDGSFWGTTFYHGAHHCGTIYRLDPASQKLVSVVDFTGKEGAFPGRNPDAGLVSDGRGWLWGTTRFGGKADAGTIFRLNEQTGAFVTIAEFGVNPKVLPSGGSMTELSLDERGQLWGSTVNTVFKIDPRRDEVKHIATFGGDKREPFGSQFVGRLAADGRGYVWGCALADRTQQKATLFRIATATDAFEVVKLYPNANQGWSGWHPTAPMYRDSAGSIWFTGVLEQGGPRAICTLNRIDPIAGAVMERSSTNAFRYMDTPVEDGHRRLWGCTAMDGASDALYSFDLDSKTFRRELEFTGHGSQPRSGSQPVFGRPMRASDGNHYSVTRYGGPGNGGTIYRLRFGPTPITQEAVIQPNGGVELHGILRPNGRNTEVAFEWGLDPGLKDGRVLSAGTVSAKEEAKPVQALLSGLKRGTKHYFRLRGQNVDNKMPQRGAILAFTIPLESREEPASADQAKRQKVAAAAGQSLAQQAKHRLKVVLVPGTGAGLVRGQLDGLVYEVGRRYTLTAQDDNGYIFAQWAGPGISGSMAENPQLSFVFSEELANHPVITATFLRNPFHDKLLGHYHGLVTALDGVTPSLSSTGALELQAAPLGLFTGNLRFDGDILPITGVFDTGGSARFGEAQAFTGMISRADKPSLLLRLQLDLSPEGLGGVSGQVGLWKEGEETWLSQLQARFSVSAASLANDVVIQYLKAAGRIPVELVGLDSPELTCAAQVLLQPNGRLQLSADLPDGTVLLNDLHLNRLSEFSFFQSLPRGSFGLELPLANLLERPALPDRPNGWWFDAEKKFRSIVLQATEVKAAGKGAEGLFHQEGPKEK